MYLMKSGAAITGAPINIGLNNKLSTVISAMKGKGDRLLLSLS